MSKKKIILLVAGALAALGAIAAVSAQGHRGGRDGGHEFGMQDPTGADRMGRQGFMQRFRGPLTQDEFDTRTRERFARLDKNSDGILDASEIEAAFSNRDAEGRGWSHRGGAAGSGEHMHRAFDTNKDGKVTKDEFQAVITKRFAEMDLNNDGRIADEDLPPNMRGRNVLAGGADTGRGNRFGHGRGMGQGNGLGGGMMGFMRDADTNKDGVITRDEAMASAMKHFDAMDRNKDGVIDKADSDAARKEMVDYRVKRFIHAFGADKDGKVTREQFNAKAKERFAQMDRDGDGKIGRNEGPGRGMMGHEHGGRGRWHGRGEGAEGRPGRGEPGAPPQPKN
jgi:Ca2+-binding EF-hand superfamily protein